MRVIKRIVKSLLFDLLLPWSGVALVIIALSLYLQSAWFSGFYVVVVIWLFAWGIFIEACLFRRKFALSANTEEETTPG